MTIQKSILIIFVFLLTNITPASSYSNDSHWKNEPDSFLGLKFGSPIDDKLNECPNIYDLESFNPESFDVDSMIESMKSMCIEKLDKYRIIKNPPDLGFPYDATGVVVNNNLEAISLNFKNYNFTKMYELLLSKYGDPTENSIDTYQTYGGMEIEGRVHTWKGNIVSISLKEYGDSIDKSSVFVSTKAFIDSHKSNNKKNAETYKDNL